MLELTQLLSRSSAFSAASGGPEAYSPEKAGQSQLPTSYESELAMQRRSFRQLQEVVAQANAQPQPEGDFPGILCKTMMSPK